ncbi:MAG: ABC transporter ATP-binding protein [Methanomicrobia archaeon]|nr:ABC transporter ATP-binding protein [Methanomicrobia archaeon]
MGIIEIENLKIYYKTVKGYVKAVENVSFNIEKGETMGLVGESGCGKTTIGMSIMRLLPRNAKIIGGKIIFEGEDLIKKREEEMEKIRWKEISMIFQAAMNALNPVYKIENQILEAIYAHENISKKEAVERVSRLYSLVGIDPRRAKEYPHEYSGGMKQRAVIAMALACNPKFIIADEPTTALDVMVQDQIISEIKEIQKKLQMTMMYISHDISVIAETCKRIGVMYAGSIVEYADAIPLFKKPLHPYTKALMNSFPSIKGEKKKLTPVPGEPPNLLNPPSGCRFHPRCSKAKSLCRKKAPKFVEYQHRHFVACHYVG